MSQVLDAARSLELAHQINSKANAAFDNAYQAVLVTAGATYVQGFLVLNHPPARLMEHAWVELDGAILDPSLPYLTQTASELRYYPAQRLSLKTLKAAIEEAEEDYPEDDPLPIYGDPPYEYYGDLMLGGKDYLQAFAAATECLNSSASSLN
jgi:hypothetical protein